MCQDSAGNIWFTYTDLISHQVDKISFKRRMWGKSMNLAKGLDGIAEERIMTVRWKGEFLKNKVGKESKFCLWSRQSPWECISQDMTSVRTELDSFRWQLSPAQETVQWKWAGQFRASNSGPPKSVWCGEVWREFGQEPQGPSAATEQ